MSQTGTTKDSGFTLVELTVVVLLIGLVLSIVLPRVRETVLHDDLQRVINYIANTSRELRNQAARDHADHVLIIDLNGNRLWACRTDLSPEEKADTVMKGSYELPKGVRISDICQPGDGKTTEGEATITFNHQGYAEPTLIHLSEGDREATLYLEPFMEDVALYERYIEEIPPGEIPRSSPY